MANRPQASKRWRAKKKVKQTIDFIRKKSRKDKDFNKRKLSKQFGLKL